MKTTRLLNYCGLTLAASLTLSGCSTLGQVNKDPQAQEAGKHLATEPQMLAEQGIKALQEHDLEAALKVFNKALRLDITDSTLNYLVGLTYHLKAVNGDAAMFPLAEQGYNLAIKFDPSNWYAYYQSGLLALDQRNFKRAQERFAEALLLQDKDPDLLYNMLSASYYAGDITTAASMRDQLQKLESGSTRFLRASSLISAAMNRQDRASQDLARLVQLGAEKNQAELLKDRLDDWAKFHKRVKSSKRTVEDAQDKSNTTADIDKPAFDDNAMVIVDVVIIRTQSNYSSSKGVNLLSGLSLQYGKSIEDTIDVAYDSGNQITDDFSRAITKTISIPGITYSLNIANVNEFTSEILARPTLTATNGEQSEFFSGLNIQAATAPNGDGDPIDFNDEVGVKLALRPEFLDDGRIKLEVEAERKYLNQPNVFYTGFTSKLESTRTTVKGIVTMNLGETLILSGMHEKESQTINSGVPVLQDLPVVQYLFKREEVVDYTKSVLILLTPRSPDYTKHAIPGEHPTSSLNELMLKNSDWFENNTNVQDIFRFMNNNLLYRQFRTGDLEKDQWDVDNGFAERLSNAARFLYY